MLDLVEEEIKDTLIERLEQMVVAREFNVLGSRDVLSQVAAGVDRDQRITFAMEDQGRCLDRRQKVADIDFVVGPRQGEDGPRTRCGSLEMRKPLNEGLVIDPARRIKEDQDALTPMGFQYAEVPLELLARHAPWLRLARRVGAAQHEGRGSLGVGG